MFRRMAADMRLKAAARRLYGDLQLAKIKAIEKSTSVSVIFDQPITEGASATTYSYVVIEDKDNNCQCNSPDCGTSGDDIILGKTLISKEFRGITISENTFPKNQDNLHALRFNAKGFPKKGTDNGFASGTVTLSNQYGTTAQVIVNSLGRIRLKL